MSHLTRNTDHWYAGSPIDLDVTVDNVASADLSSLVWVLGGVVELSGASISASDNSDGDAVVTVSIGAADATEVGVFDWQLRGDVSGEGPRVLAIGTLTLSEQLSA